MAKTRKIPSGKVKNHHWINFKTGDQYQGRDLHLVILSGMIIPHVQGKNKHWYTETMLIEVDVKKPLVEILVPQKPHYRRTYRPVFLIKEWNAYAGLNAIFNAGASENNGQSVNDFNTITTMPMTSNGEEYKALKADFLLHTPDHPVTLHCKIEVRDRDAYVYRVAFQLQMLVCFAGYAESA